MAIRPDKKNDRTGTRIVLKHKKARRRRRIKSAEYACQIRTEVERVVDTDRSL